VKSILKSSGERYKKLREAGKPLYQFSKSAKMMGQPSEKGEAQSDKRSALLDTIGVFDADAETADDLKQIKGVGPQMEKTLNEIGIFTFAQVSRMTAREYELLDELTGSFPGRAQRDDWAGQAKRLNEKN
jgi:molybdopterin-containing oxidoreductase family membrane subunit